jgi:hypothetical protein
MSGLFRRTRDTAELPADEVIAENARTAEREAVATADPDGRIAEDVPLAPTPDVPAGADPDDYLGPRPTTRRRGPLRKRLRHLRRVRELLLRDLGGLTYELHRTPGAAGDGERLQASKIARLQELDAELKELEERLADTTGALLLREPGIGGTCPSCGELFGSEARFCSNCGTPVREREEEAAR